MLKKFERRQVKGNERTITFRFSLQLAAESNSAECARILLEAGATAGTRDDSGMTALTLMVTKMPSVVSEKNFKHFNAGISTQLCTHFENNNSRAGGKLSYLC